MWGLLALNPEIQNSPDATELELKNGGEVVFDHVSFSYNQAAGKYALSDVSFRVPPGKKLGIVGPSGCGKTTLTRLLFRFYDPQVGSVRIDGADIREVTQASLRGHIGVVPQDTVLFNDTARANILYGKIDATDEQLFAAARHAHIHERILSFPEGYGTRVGERGLRLSGGEKQRVAIARVILKNPRILVLDESTSALDTGTERAIQASLDELAQSRTTLTIAHRLSTIVDSDEIIVLDKGSIVERGDHTTLLSLKGVYYSLWMEQQNDRQAAAAKPEDPAVQPADVVVVAK